MLRLSKMTDYGLVIMHCLAGQRTISRSAAWVAKEVQLAVPTVSKILKQFVAGNLVSSTRGSNGGYTLLRQAEKISLAEVITVLEGLPALTDCSDTTRQCDYANVCCLRDNVTIVNQIILSTLSRISIADMLQPLCQKALTLKGIPVQLEAST